MHKLKHKLKRSAKKPAGTAPGTPTYIGNERKEKIIIDIFDFTETEFTEKRVENVEECFPFKDTPTVTWLNVTGVHDLGVIEKIGREFDIHPLVLEDITNTHQRPKYEDFENYVFVVLKVIEFDAAKEGISVEQISFIISRYFVISFQENEKDIFDPVRDRIRKAKGKIRKMGCDYLAYSLIDTIVDNYFPLLEKVGDKLEDMEEEIIREQNYEIMDKIRTLKLDLIQVRKSIWPLRDVISGLQRAEAKMISPSTQIYLRDVHDHAVQIIDTVETFKERVSGMHDTYLSVVSNRMNEIMKVLTIIATIFIPLTFIAGVYGMNFRHMPELEWKYGYYFIWGIMIIALVTMLAFFKNKKWL